MSVEIGRSFIKRGPSKYDEWLSVKQPRSQGVHWQGFG